MNSKRLLYLVGLVFSIFGILTISCVSSDLIGKVKFGEKNITLNYSISNINEYDDYVFILYDVITGCQVFNLNQTLSCFYTFAQPQVYVINKNDFFSLKTKNNESMWHDLIKNDPAFIGSPDQLYTFITVQKNDPVEYAEIELRITYLDEKQHRIGVDKDKVIYRYNDGSFEEIAITSQYGFPKPTKSALLPYWFESLWFIWLPIFSMIGIGTIFFYRKRISSPQ